jgi:hypothetical protein
MDETAYVDCRCPGCDHIRGQAANGSQVQLQCRQCGIKFCGLIRAGRFKVTNQHQVGPKRKKIIATNPPTLTG